MKNHLSSKSFLLSFLFSISAMAQILGIKVSEGHEIFYSKANSGQISLLNSTSIFWWNFIVFKDLDPESLGKVCEKMTSLGIFVKTGCGSLSPKISTELEAWAKDLPLRTEFSGAKILNEKLVKSESLLGVGLSEAVQNLIIRDPLQTFKEYKKLSEVGRNSGLKAELEQIEISGGVRWYLPVQFAENPTATRNTKEIFNSVLREFPDSVGIGPHFSSLNNEKVVRTDLERVSVFALALIFLQIGLFVMLKRKNLILLIPPVAVATFVAAWATSMAFGSVHGLTLAFGSGLVGLALDYGLHSCFNISWPGVWRANLFGLLTTAAGFLSIGLSDVPLLKQLSFFSMIGLSVAYTIYFAIHKKYPGFFGVEPLKLEPKLSKIKLAVTLLLVILGAGFKGKIDMGLSSFNYQTPEIKELEKKIYGEGKKNVGIWILPSEVIFIDSKMEGYIYKEFMDSGAQLAGPVSFLRNLEDQKFFAKTWEKFCQSKDQFKIKKIWHEYFKHLNCQPMNSSMAPPAYVEDYIPRDSHQTKSVNLLLPKNSEQERILKKNWPEAFQPKDVIEKFGKTLYEEAQWMAPLALLLTVGLLQIYFLNFRLTLLSLIPFFTGLGMFNLYRMIAESSLTFIDWIGLIMVFGLSLDYGIFATNSLSQAGSKKSQGIWSCLFLAGIVTILGFFPLMFATHPVLSHLGTTLVFGTLGTLLGTFWGIPNLSGFLKLHLDFVPNRETSV